MQSQFSNVDVSLLRKYDRPGPRYTSYPTAPLFSPSFNARQYKQEIISTNSAGSASDISLYVHFPFCDTLCYFCGCTMMVTRDRNRIDEYIRYLKKEIDMVASLLNKARRVTQIHWGGGTPTHLTPEQILDVGEYILEKFNVDPETEMSVEIDPRELTQKHLGTLRHVGFNRLSMGVQDFDERVQKAVNRIEPESMVLQVMKWAEALEFESMNIDLIYGLPFQSVASFRETVLKVLQFSPDRIAVFNYAHVPWLKPQQKLIRGEDLPAPGRKLDILKMTIDLLSSHGYEYIGMDHFAKPTDDLAISQKKKTLYRNFQGYSTKAGADLYGLGMSSISHFQNIYAQNHKTLAEYYLALDTGDLATHVGYRMTDDDHIRYHVITRLMCDLELDTFAVEKKFNINFEAYFSSSLTRLQQFVDDSLVAVTPGTIAIVGAGRLLLRNIVMCFDAYIETMSTNKPVFSRTI